MDDLEALDLVVDGGKDEARVLEVVLVLVVGGEAVIFDLVVEGVAEDFFELLVDLVGLEVALEVFEADCYVLEEALLGGDAVHILLGCIAISSKLIKQIEQLILQLPRIKRHLLNSLSPTNILILIIRLIHRYSTLSPKRLIIQIAHIQILILIKDILYDITRMNQRHYILFFFCLINKNIETD